MLAEARHPWDRQDGESSKAFRLFRLYLKLGPARSLRKLQSRINRLKAQGRWDEADEAEGSGPESASRGGWLGSLSSRNAWVSRATAYDDWRVAQQKETERKLLERDVALAMERRRKSRSRNWHLATLFCRELVAKLTQGGRLARDEQGNVVRDKDGNPIVEGWAPKDLQALGIVADRLGMVEERAFKGLPDESRDALGLMGEGLARLFDEFRAARALESEGIDPAILAALDGPTVDAESEPVDPR